MEAIRRKLLKNPRDAANKLSVLLFFWTYDILKKGYQRTLELTDLYETLPEDRSSNLGDRLERDIQKSKKGQPSLIKAIATTFWKNYLFLGMICVLNDIIIRLTQPYLLGQLLLYFRKDSSMCYEDALWYATAIVVLNALNMMTVNQYFFGCFHIGMKIRVSLCSLIYRKALKLSQTALRETAVVNLLSNDVNRFDLISFLVHSMWSAPIMTIIIGYFLWLRARWAGMIGIAVVFLIVPIQSYTGKLSSIFRLKTALRTDKRIKFMEEIIIGVRVIKMFGWEIPFGKMINSARKKELNILRKNSYVRGLYMTFALFTTRMAVFCTMLSICLMYGSENITAAKIFVISAYFHLIAHSMSQMFVRGIAELAEAYVSVKRLQHFLERDEINPIITTNNREIHEVDDTAIAVTNLKAKWIIRESDYEPKNVKGITDKSLVEEENWNKDYTLDQINLHFKKGSLIGIVGPVGSALLHELPSESGFIYIKGSVSYASQEPWIFSGSVRQNIVFTNTFDQMRYDMVIRSCALDIDINHFECGDKLLIGDRGISLSGGQKARISLARCIYRKSDIYLFDDPLSAVDSHIGRHLFNECIGPNGFLAKNGCTRILVTHQIHFLKEADFVVVLRNGKADFHGTPTELSNSGIDFSEFLQMKSDTNHVDDGETLPKLGNGVSNISQATNKEEVAKLEDISRNKSRDSTFKTYFQSGANSYVSTIIFILFLLSQILASGCDFWVAFWSISFYTICVRASHKLHNVMFKGIISTSLRFFDTNPSGRILNLFSKDLGTVDEYLPKSLLDSSQSILIMTGSISLTVIVRPYFIVPIVLIGIIFIYVRKIYLNSSQDIKRMEGIILGNEVGLAITQIMALTGMLQWGIRQSAEVSNQLMSVERIIQYRDLTPEKAPDKIRTVDHRWPSYGKIEFKAVNYRYSETLSPVLTNINFIIQPKEKIGICGRSGAGKSSIIGALFRLAIIEGDIFIDGVNTNTNTIDLHELRSKISVIPQDPVLFSGTLRRNLDPFEMYSDAEIWRALDDVELKHIASESLGLQRSVQSSGSNFSVGEKQLICLARALLQKSKILIADEATGNVSLSTDLIIQQKIQEKFIDCTVLTIAHRLNTIVDSDRILVMGNGEILEFAPPNELLKSKRGVFYGLINSLGKNEAERLTKLTVCKTE